MVFGFGIVRLTVLNLKNFFLRVKESVTPRRLFFLPSRRAFIMQKRLAIISIIVEDRFKSGDVNSLLSEYGEYIVGRMGVPYRERAVSVLCVVIDAPMEVINSLTGKLGMIAGVSAKTLMSKI